MSRKWLTPGLLLLLFAIGILTVFVTSSVGPETGAPASRSFKVFPAPAENVSGISYDGASLWITIDGQKKIYQVDPEAWVTKSEISIPIEAAGGSAWDGQHLWQSAYLEKKIYQLELPSGKILAEIPSPGNGMCSGLTFDGEHLWIANFEDKKIYQIDQKNEGRIVQTTDGYYETTGVAWDGRDLWIGLLVGTVSIGEKTPYTGFVHQRRSADKQILSVYHIPGVGAGTSNWTSGNTLPSTMFWWYDGFNNRIVRVQEPDREAAGIDYLLGLLVVFAGTSAALALTLVL